MGHEAGRGGWWMMIMDRIYDLFLCLFLSLRFPCFCVFLSVSILVPLAR